MTLGSPRPTSLGRPPPSLVEPTTDGIYEAFVVRASTAQRAALGWIGARTASVLGIGLLCCVAVTDGTTAQRATALVVALFAIAAGHLLWRRAIPTWVLDTMMVSAVAAIAVLGVQGGPAQPAIPVFLVVLGIVVWVIRPLRTSLLHLAALGACYATILAAGPDEPLPVSRWVAVMAALLISALCVRWLVARVASVAAAQRAARDDADAAVADLERHNTAKREFLARMSHELRTPLNAILGFADVLHHGLAGPLNERQRTYTADIAASGRDLLGLVDDLLDQAKVETGAIDVTFQRVDLAKVAADAALLIRGRAREAGVGIEITTPGGPAWADADPLRIRQVVWNLVGNAVKYTPAGQDVDVRITVHADRVAVSVHDTGPGIAPEDQERVFEPYVQGPGSQQGSGIGLAICRRIVEAHHGELEVSSAPGIGSTFRFEVPRQAPAVTTGERRDTASPPASRQLDVDHALLSPGSLANRALVAQVGKWLCAALALLLVVLAAITPGSGAVRAMVAAVGAAAGAVAWWIGRRDATSPWWNTTTFSVGGTLAITVGVLVSGPFVDLVPLAYGWGILATAALHSTARAWWRAVTTGVCFAGALLIAQPDGALQLWIAVMVLAVANVRLAGWLAERLRDVVSDALNTRLDAEATRARAETVSRHKRDFLANTSHELCTPLNAIIGFAQVLREGLAGPLTDAQQSDVEDIHAAGVVLLALITDLLELSKLESGRLVRNRQPVAVVPLVQAAAAGLEPAARRRRIRVQVRVPDHELPDVQADPNHLGHAVENLIANAIKFTPDDGWVEVVVGRRAADPAILISVRDAGIGILPAQRPHLFEPFHQGTRPLPEHARGGTGLGLPLARGLVELEGGSITLDSTPDVGSTFTVCLPLPLPEATDPRPVVPA